MLSKIKGNIGSFPDADAVLWLLLTTFKISGISPFNITRKRVKNGRRYLQTKISIVWYSFCLLLLALTIVHTIWAPRMLIRLEKSVKSEFTPFARKNLTGDEQEAFSSMQTRVVKVLHPLLICLMSLSARVTSVSVLSKNVPRLMWNMNKVENILQVPRSICRKDGAILLSFFLVFLVLNIPLMAYHLLSLHRFHSGWGNVWEAFSMFNIFTTFSMELQFMTLCYIARSRFIYVNAKLTAFVSDEFTYKTADFPVSSSCKIDNAKTFVLDLNKAYRRKAPVAWSFTLAIRSLRNGHILLLDVMQNINEIFQLQLLISVFACISKILFNLYFSIFGFIASSEKLPNKIQRGQMYIVCLWTAYYCLRFLFVVGFAHAAAAECRKTKRIIIKINPKTFEEPDKAEIKIFSENLSGRDFEFSACGLFNLNMALIASSFSSCITYLVIMAQLR